MKFKKKVKVETDDFYYDLFSGGYINPKKLLIKSEDADKIIAAIAVIKEFESELQKQGILEEN